MWRRRPHRDRLKCIPSDARAAQHTARAPATGREARCQIDAGRVRETRGQPRECERCVLPESGGARVAGMCFLESGACFNEARDGSHSMKDWIPDNLDLGSLAPKQPTAMDWFLERVSDLHRGSGGWIDRTLLRAPDCFGQQLAPILHAARAAVIAGEPSALGSDLGSDLGSVCADAELERALHIARQRLHRRIVPSASLPAPLLSWGGGGLIVCVPARIPAAAESAAACVWLSHSDEIAYARANRLDHRAGSLPDDVAAWLAFAESSGVEASAWSLPLPSFCESGLPIAVEIAPNPTGFMHAMYIAHAGAAVIVVGSAAGVGGTQRVPGEPLPRARVVPSGWSYLKPDRSWGTSAPYFPHGAPHWSDAVFVPDEALFLACARATWPASLRDAFRVAFSG